MPPLPAVTDVLRCKLLWSDASDVNVSSTLYFGYTGGAPDASDALSLATSLYTAATNFQAVYGEDTMLTGTTVTDLSSSSAAEATHSAVADGFLTGPSLAGGTALLMNYTIARRYRGGKPRNYFPFGNAGTLETRQSWIETFLNNVTNAWNNFIGAAIGATGGSTVISRHVNVSYYSGSRVVISPTTGRARNVSILRASPQVDSIVGFSPSPRPGSQRQRN